MAWHDATAGPCNNNNSHDPSFYVFCLTICKITDHLDSSTCTALGNRNFAFQELIQALTGGKEGDTSHIFAKGRIVHDA